MFSIRALLRLPCCSSEVGSKSVKRGEPRKSSATDAKIAPIELVLMSFALPERIGHTMQERASPNLSRAGNARSTNAKSVFLPGNRFELLDVFDQDFPAGDKIDQPCAAQLAELATDGFDRQAEDIGNLLA